MKPKIKISSEQRYLLYVVSIVLVCLAIYFLGRWIGKRAYNEDNKGKVPSETDWGQELTNTESVDIQSHARRLYDDMDGLNFMRDISVYSSYLATTDRVFVGAANFFFENYGDGENLATWLEDESFYFTSLSTGLDVKKSVLERLAKNNITPQ